MQNDKILIDAARSNLEKGLTYQNLLNTCLGLINANGNWRQQECLNLVASEALISPLTRKTLSSDMAMRTAGGYIGEKNRYFIASKNIDMLESYLFALLTDLFNCDQADWRLLGGTQACHAVYAALCKRGDTIISVPEIMGGDSSNTYLSMPGYLGLNIVNMPFRDDGYTIDLDKLEHLIKVHTPRLVCIGFSISLFKQPIKEIKSLCKTTNTLIYYDAAHELGLIAGNQLPNPFDEGADIVSGSTGKSFSGPQGGLILWDNNLSLAPLESSVFPNFVGTYQLNRVAALCFSACELREFGKAFMSAVVINAKALAGALEAEGFTIFGSKKGYTETNQVLLQLPKEDGIGSAKKLEQINIICNETITPGNTHTISLRLSTTEITRLGMGIKEMKTIAILIAARLKNREKTCTLIKKVMLLKNQFKIIGYC